MKNKREGRERKEKGGRRGADDPHLAGRGELTSHLVHFFLPSALRQIWDVSRQLLLGKRKMQGILHPIPPSSDTV